MLTKCKILTCHFVHFFKHYHHKQHLVQVKRLILLGRDSNCAVAGSHSQGVARRICLIFPFMYHFQILVSSQNPTGPSTATSNLPMWPNPAHPSPLLSSPLHIHHTFPYSPAESGYIHPRHRSYILAKFLPKFILPSHIQPLGSTCSTHPSFCTSLLCSQKAQSNTVSSHAQNSLQKYQNYKASGQHPSIAPAGPVKMLNKGNKKLKQQS